MPPVKAKEPVDIVDIDSSDGEDTAVPPTRSIMSKVQLIPPPKSSSPAPAATPVVVDPQFAKQKLDCRSFWQAGAYEIGPSSFAPVEGELEHARVHPKFLHSNATSHKWAFGAIAELLDNAVDEIPNGATFVKVDKILNVKDNSPALLFQDDGGGMDPEGIRKCMSLGYSSKKSKTTIGQYGNGFKTSTMRLGADVIVFSRAVRSGRATQSVGLLSYTFLRLTGQDDVIVPMVDFDISNNWAEPIIYGSQDNWSTNLNTILEWSLFASKEELMTQFEDIGSHGTKVIIFNLWLNDEGIYELSFDDDDEWLYGYKGVMNLVNPTCSSHMDKSQLSAEPFRGKLISHMDKGPMAPHCVNHDIKLRDEANRDNGSKVNKRTAELRSHISYRLRYSLRAYASILYLRKFKKFRILLRGKPVEQFNIADELQYPQVVTYKPQGAATSNEAFVKTTIGFIKEAPRLGVCGFNVYHKNRLIRPFWKVTRDGSSVGNGVVGVLEANFIEPAHDKQDFERSSHFVRLETKMKQMVSEYWRSHCHFMGHVVPGARRVIPPAEPPSKIQKLSRVEPQVSRLSSTGAQPVIDLSTVTKDVDDIVLPEDSVASTIEEICERNIQLFTSVEEHKQREHQLRQQISKMEKELEETRNKCAQLAAYLESKKKRQSLMKQAGHIFGNQVASTDAMLARGGESN